MAVTREQSLMNNPTALVKENFGWFYGDVYFIKVSPNEEDMTADASKGILSINLSQAGNLLDELDQIPGSRKASEVLNYFSGGTFVATRTGEDAMRNHKLYVHALLPVSAYIKTTFQQLQKFIRENNRFSLRDFTVNPVRHVLASNMFGTDGMPADLIEAIKKFSAIFEEDISDFETGIKMQLLAMGTLGSIALNVTPKFREAKQGYFTAATRFMQSQAKVILDNIHCHAKGERVTHLLAMSIVELIKEKNPTFADQQLSEYLLNLNLNSLQKYLTHAEIISIPASITAGDNLMQILSTALAALTNNKALMTQLREDLNKQNLAEHFNEAKLKVIIDADRFKRGILHRIYLEALRREDIFKTPERLALETKMFRNTDREIEISEEISIPANSTIVILPAMPRFDTKLWDKPEVFDADRYVGKKQLEKYSLSVFSDSKRRCPATQASEYMFKTFITYIATFYDLELENIEAKKLGAIQVKLTPRENVPAVEESASSSACYSKAV